MKSALSTCLVIALAACIGCDQGGTPGGPGTSSPSSAKKIIGQAEETFTLSLPTLSTKIKQGETKNVTISIKRGKNFGEDVKLKFEGVPKGVTLEPASSMIKHSDQDAQIKVNVAADAALGDFTIKVIGEPTKGGNASNELKLTIEKK